MSQKRKYKRVGQTELSPEIDAEVDRQIMAAEKDIQEIRVNFRWGKEQIDTVKQAAKHMGIPYQTYIKQIIYRQSIEDLNKIQTARNF